MQILKEILLTKQPVAREETNLASSNEENTIPMYVGVSPLAVASCGKNG